MGDNHTKILIACGLTPFSTIFQSYYDSQFTYPCVSWLLHTSTPYNNLSKQLTAFPDRLLAHWWRMSDACHIYFNQTLERILAQQGFKLTTAELTPLVAISWATGAMPEILIWYVCLVCLEFNAAFNSFGHITAVSAPTHVFLAFPHQYLHNTSTYTTFFRSHWLLMVCLWNTNVPELAIQVGQRSRTQYWHLCNRRLLKTLWENNYTFLYRDFLYFCKYFFKVICYRFEVCGKGISEKISSLRIHMPNTKI